MRDSDAHPEIHAALAVIYRDLANSPECSERDYFTRLADYHEEKAANPLCEIPIPQK